MSESFPVSEITSPVSSVRSSEAPIHNSHVSGTASPSKPEAITPTNLTQYNGTELPSRQWTDESRDLTKLSHEADNPSGPHHNGSSDPNTPRLPPATFGNDDLESIPKEEAMHLDAAEKNISTTSSQFNEHTFFPSHALSSSLSSSTSEPITPGFASQRYTPRASGLTEIRDDSVSSSPLENAQKDTGPFPKIEPRSYSKRTMTNGPHQPSPTSGTWHQETEHPSIVDERSAREEAFSEKRARSSSRSSQSRVEKRIEATLADAEPSSHASSRKSSHTLGLFKETTASQSSKRGQERSRTASANAIDASAALDHEPAAQRPHARSVFEDARQPGGQLGSLKGPLSMLGSCENKLAGDGRLSQDSRHLSKPTSNSDVGLPTRPRSNSDTIANESKKKDVTRLSKASDATKQTVPTRLLEEIRDYHNLTAPFHDKFRTTPPKPGGLVHDKNDAESLKQSQSGISRDQDNRASAIGADKKGEPENEEDESEQISSALYYPHQAPSPDALQDVSIDDARKIKEASTDNETNLPEPALASTTEIERSEDVDIALQMHNKNRYFHGDLSKAHARPIELEDKQASESDASSASESEYESQDDRKRSGVQEDSSLTDDGDATPRASPNTRKSWMLARSQKTHRGPAAPLGAVELKPYNHQVGGHTNLFRFSKRAVCKQLSNRENVFYEVVERQHPELLKFLPKYDPQISYHSLHRIESRRRSQFLYQGPTKAAITDGLPGTLGF